MRDEPALTPTETAMNELQTAYDFYNRELFGGELPPCLITLQRKEVRVLGYYSPERFATNDGKRVTDEIAMNPQHFRKKVPTEILQTLVHEMCHLWHIRCSPKSTHPKKFAYHNEHWAAKMKKVGLQPYNKHGKETGYQMGDRPIPGGPFDIATMKLIDTGFSITWYEVTEAKPSLVVAPPGTKPGTPIKTPAGARRKFSCSGCDQVCWAKGTAVIDCGLCKVPMI